MSTEAVIGKMVENARKAQVVFETFSQEQVDAAVRAVGKAIYDNAEMLARMAVEETKIGNYDDKVMKNKGKAKATWYRLKGVKSRGILRRIEEQGLVEIAKPVGVVGAIMPVTNPTLTPVHNVMIALKGGNAIIMCPHPSAKQVSIKGVELMNEALKKVGAPDNLVQVVEDPSVEMSSGVMKAVDVCIATGGPGMVKATYSSGRPAYGVGAGNVQVLIDKDADIPDAVKKLVTGRTYDNGILCTCEQTAFCPRETVGKIVEELKNAGGAYFDKPEDIEKIRKAVFPEGNINKKLVGASAVKIAEAAGVTVPANTKFLAVPVQKFGAEELLAKEKLFPVLALYTYDKWADAVAGAITNLKLEGQGHSCVIHSFTTANIEYAAERIPVSRFVVNQIGSSALGGAFYNGLNPTATLGCGSWGNNSLSENLWFHHLINISRLAYMIPDAKIPTDEEIWND
ncbi:succinate-semialdehyde dehydrogenase [Spirochaetia bacterium]|nr:succinate-semialdehyde dehydrogenase [Spirochaetia bacterium]